MTLSFTDAVLSVLLAKPCLTDEIKQLIIRISVLAVLRCFLQYNHLPHVLWPPLHPIFCRAIVPLQLMQSSKTYVLI